MESAEDDILVVLCTFPDEAKARQIGAALVEKQVAACVNLVPGARSIYRWEGTIEDADETLGLIKTTRTGFPALRDELETLHPYEVPEIIALPVADGSTAYLSWVAGQVRR